MRSVRLDPMLTRSSAARRCADGAVAVSRWRPAWAAAGRRARAWSKRCILLPSSAASIAASSRCTSPRAGAPAMRSASCLPHVVTTSYLTHEPIAKYLNAASNYGYAGPLLLSPGRSIGLRIDSDGARPAFSLGRDAAADAGRAEAEGARESAHAALIGWAQPMGEGSDYTDNLPHQCLHPVGHWYRSSESAPQRRAASNCCASGRAAVSDAAQHRHAGRRSRSRRCSGCTSSRGVASRLK